MTTDSTLNVNDDKNPRIKNKNLSSIRQKLNAIQLGLLRYRSKKGSITLHVLANTQDDTLICTITGNDNPDLKKLINKKVSLVQKSENDYLYITGQVQEKADPNNRTVLIYILKACWFVRRTKGSLSWLQQKYIYDTMPQDELGLAS